MELKNKTDFGYVGAEETQKCLSVHELSAMLKMRYYTDCQCVFYSKELD